MALTTEPVVLKVHVPEAIAPVADVLETQLAMFVVPPGGLNMGRDGALRQLVADFAPAVSVAKHEMLRIL